MSTLTLPHDVVVNMSGKYLVVDTRPFIPACSFEDDLDGVRRCLGDEPNPIRQLVFKVNKRGRIVRTRMAKVVRSGNR